MDTTAQEILDRFSESWTTTLARYADIIDNYPDSESLIPVFSFIKKLKQAGHHKYFRLNESMRALIISRSVEPVLRPDQKFVTIKASNNKFVVTLKDSKKMYKEYTIKDLDDERLTELLQILKGTLID
jgi:hypothetical protein